MAEAENIKPPKPRKKLKILEQIEQLPIANWPVQQWRGSEVTEIVDRVALEEPFEIRINGRSLATIMRTPGHDRELALGFLLTEGIVSHPEQVLAINRATDRDGLLEENVWDVSLAPEAVPTDFFEDSSPKFERRFVVASSCGLCGKTSIVEVCRHLPPLPTSDFKLSAEVLYKLPESLRQSQQVFEQTGGLHAAGVFDAAGELLLLREDIGRHNAVDKVIGRLALDGKFPLPAHILLVSGRVSFEIVQKALAAQIPLVAAISAPSSLALNLAEDSSLTLVGFLRGQSFNVYTNPERIE